MSLFLFGGSFYLKIKRRRWRTRTRRTPTSPLRPPICRSLDGVPGQLLLLLSPLLWSICCHCRALRLAVVQDPGLGKRRKRSIRLLLIPGRVVALKLVLNWFSIQRNFSNGIVVEHEHSRQEREKEAPVKVTGFSISLRNWKNKRPNE